MIYKGFWLSAQEISSKVTRFFIFVTARDPGSQASPHVPRGAGQYLFWLGIVAAAHSREGHNTSPMSIQGHTYAYAEAYG